MKHPHATVNCGKFLKTQRRQREDDYQDYKKLDEVTRQGRLEPTKKRVEDDDDA